MFASIANPLEPLVWIFAACVVTSSIKLAIDARQKAKDPEAWAKRKCAEMAVKAAQDERKAKMLGIGWKMFNAYRAGS